MALTAGRQFAAWPDTMLAADPKTSPVASGLSVMPLCFTISRRQQPDLGVI
jgi:hypothetical protein